MLNERIDRLEERLAWLQRHVAEQDKAMLEMAGQLDRVKAELTRLKGLGATHLADHEEDGTRWATLADPEGNEFDVAAA